jgi:hypothetical protein
VGQKLLSEGTKPDKVEINTIEGNCTADTLVLRMSSLTHKKGAVASMEAVVASKVSRKEMLLAMKTKINRHAASGEDLRQVDEMRRAFAGGLSIPPSFISELEEARRLVSALDMVDIDVGFMYYHEGKDPESMNYGARARYCCQLLGEDGQPTGANTELLRRLAQRMVDKKEAVITVGRTSIGGCVWERARAFGSSRANTHTHAHAREVLPKLTCLAW